MLLSCFSVAVVMTYLASLNVVTERMTENIKYPHEFRTSTDAFDAALGGVYTLQYSMNAGESEGISNPEYLRGLDKFSEWLRADPQVMNVYAYSDIIKRLNRNMNGDDAAYFSIPESRELASQYLLLYEMSLPVGADLSSQINFDRSRSRVIVSLKTMDAVTMIALQKRIYAWQQENLP
jgi:hypothetical protein